jgi:hypothetical protein
MRHKRGNEMNVEQLEGVELDYLVAQFTGMLRAIPGTKEEQLGGYSPSTKWQHAGALIDKAQISVIPADAECSRWEAHIGGWMCHDFVHGDFVATGATPQQAVARVFAASKTKPCATT